MDEIIDAEVVEAVPTRAADGRLLPGHSGPLRPKGSKGKVSHALLASFDNYITEHPDENPVITLINLSMGRAVDSKGQAIEVPLTVRQSAAGRLLGTFCPPSNTVKFGDVVKIDARGVAAMAEAAKIPGMRGMLERVAHQIASATVSSADSHIQPEDIKNPGLRKMIEAGPDL